VSKPNERDLLKAEFAKRLSKHLADKGWSQADLARAAEKYLPKGETFRRDNVSVYLNRTALPRQKQLVAIAKALGVTPADLLPGVNTSGREDTKMPYSMRPVDGEPGQAWLQVDMQVPMRKALAVLSLLDES
jgi:transcriptional regulator with XRE-family HTH domain